MQKTQIQNTQVTVFDEESNEFTTRVQCPCCHRIFLEQDDLDFEVGNETTVLKWEISETGLGHVCGNTVGKVVGFEKVGVDFGVDN